MNYHFKISLSGKVLPRLMDVKDVPMAGASITSIDFERPEQAMQALRIEMRKVLAQINFFGEYNLLVELNPEISSIPTVTNSWLPSMHAVMWIYPTDSENKIQDSIVMAQVVANHTTSFNSTIH
jgi:hypothetical protein